MDDGVRAAIFQTTGQKEGTSNKGMYMSSMAELRGGLSDAQTAHAAKQRALLRRDLEQQVSQSPLRVPCKLLEASEQASQHWASLDQQRNNEIRKGKRRLCKVMRSCT